MILFLGGVLRRLFFFHAGALVFFLVFLVMLYVATGKKFYLVIGLGLVAIGGVGAYFAFDHVQTRVATWLNPFADAQNTGYQLVQTIYSLADGDLFGVGLGLGAPRVIPVYFTDCIFAVICEQFGVIFGALVLTLNVMNALIAPGFSVWHIQLIPQRVRVRYFSFLSMTNGILVALFNLLGGVVVDCFKDAGLEVWGFATLRIFAYAMLMYDLSLLARMREDPYEQSGQKLNLFNLLIRPFKERKYLRTVGIAFLWSMMANIPGSYYSVYLLRNVEASYSFINIVSMLNVPVLVQAYPDEIGKMDFAHRRDAFCGKFSITDVFTQYRVPFTVMKPHVVHPLSHAFRENLDEFATVCRVVRGMKRFTIGCIGARTTAFKTVRFDEVTMQRHGINVECFDLSELFETVRGMADDDAHVLDKKDALERYTDFSRVPEEKKCMLAKISVAIDGYIEAYHLDAIALRCWNEMETYLRVCPCVLISELNDRGIVAACEIDMCSAITMRALTLATGGPSACLDWNNNYGEDPDKVILFHCGSTPQSLMQGSGTVTSHKMFDKGDPGSGWGTNEGRIAAFPMTYSNCKTEDGRITVYFSEGAFTGEPIEDGYFGCGGVAKIDGLQDKLLRLARGGYKHHTTVARGHVKTALEEAFRVYLGYDVESIEG